MTTDDRGRVKRQTSVGEYRLEISASGYNTLRTHFVVESGKATSAGAYLDSKTVPEEESDGTLNPLLRPGYTLLHEYVTDAETGGPAPGVTVRLMNAGVEAQTDSNGHYVLSFPTPEARIPGGLGTDTLIYEKPGYKTIVIRNLGISSEEMGGTAVDLEKGKGVIDIDGTHKLMRQEPETPAAPQAAGPALTLSPELYGWLGTSGTPLAVQSEATMGVVTSLPVTVPSTIRVGHSCTGTVCTAWDAPISLESYVHNGLLGEWVGSWDPNSLMAGAVAYRSYGAYYVAHPMGANYDICDNIFGQVYNPALNKPTRKSDAAVTATAGVVLVQPDPVTQIMSIIKAEYAAESNLASDTAKATCPDGSIGEPNFQWPCMTDFVCTGKRQASTHSRGMCQRGSQRWASGLDNTGAPGDTGGPILNALGVAISRRDWRCILNHYYNASSNSITVDPTAQAGTKLRTAFMQGALTFGNIAYEDITITPASIRVASAADGSNDHLLVTNGAYPTWEPGGARVAYEDWSTQQCPNYCGNGISVINADGTGHLAITTPVPAQWGGDFGPTWSPLGNKIAFCSARTGVVDVWMVNPDGTGLQQITHNAFISEMANEIYEEEGCYLRWSPDGTKLTFTGDAAYVPFPGIGTSYQIYTMNADGSAITQVTACQIYDPEEAFQSVCVTPSWSPDGKRIAFNDEDTPFGDQIGGGGVYTMNPDGSNITPVFQSETSINSFPQWSTDGLRILFSSDHNGNWGVWSANTDGTDLTQIIGGANGFKYSPFGIDCSHCANFDN